MTSPKPEGAGKPKLLDLSSQELRFKPDPRRGLPQATLVLQNPGSETVAFKVRTTSPRKFCVRPSTGVVLPRCKVPVQVILVPPQGDGGGAAAAVVDPAKDKFLVQAVRMSKLDGDHGKEAQELFSRAGQGAGQALQETKLRVVADGGSGGGAGSPGKPASPKASPKAAADKTPAGSSKSKLSAASASAAPAPAVGGAGGAAWVAEDRPKAGFTLLHLVLVAVLAFLVGQALPSESRDVLLKLLPKGAA